MCYLSPTAWKILEGFCTGALRNFVCYVHRTAQQLCLLSAPEPSGTLSAICTRTLQHLISHLRRNPPEPCVLSAPEPSGTLWNLISSSAICTGTVQNLISFLPGAVCTGTLRNLLRNLVLQLHRIAPELFWAKDPIASFAVGEIYVLWQVCCSALKHCGKCAA